MKIKILGTLMIVFGVFLFAGAVIAADADVLQPAETITYNENLDINGTLYADSAYIGEPGIGGVTFFNGTIINNSADPVTFGDDVRIDGEIYRVQKGGDPIKISDHVVPTITNTNNFGDSTHRWKSIWTKNADFTGNVDFTGATVTGLAMAAVSDADTLDGIDSTGFASVAHNHDSRYYTKSQSNSRFVNVDGDIITGNLEVDGFTTINNNLFSHGQIIQDRQYGGAIKAMAYVDSEINGTCSNQKWKILDGSTITCTGGSSGGSQGQYTIDFNFNVKDRFVNVTPVSSSTIKRMAQINFDGVINDIVYVFTYDSSGSSQDSKFMITVY